MENKQVKTAYNYLVLTDFSEASYNALKYTISLAKLIKGDIHVCHIANPGTIVKEDSQVAAIRELDLETKKIKNKIGAIVEMIMAEGINAIPYCAIGNIITEFKEYSETIKPDVVIIGKKVGRPKLSGKISSYLMNEYKGSLLIIGEDSIFQNNTNISIACTEMPFDQYDPNLIFSLNNQTEAPVKFLKFNSNSSDKIKVPSTWRESSYEIDQKIQFAHNGQLVPAIIEHIAENNTELFCIGRGKQKNYLQRVLSNGTTTVSGITNKIQTPILVMGTSS